MKNSDFGLFDINNFIRPIWFKLFFKIKKDIRIYVPYSRSNGWTEWADIFLGDQWVPRG